MGSRPFCARKICSRKAGRFSAVSQPHHARERLLSMKVEEADPDRYGAALAATAVATVGASLFGFGEQHLR